LLQPVEDARRRRPVVQPGEALCACQGILRIDPMNRSRPLSDQENDKRRQRKTNEVSPQTDEM
jgi:hypothetical protein